MNAYLLLANGMVFAGQSVGAEGVTVGEVVFATGTRTGKNPQTGAEIKIAACKAPKFKAGKALKDAVNA